MSLIPAIICLSIHELSHGLAAYWLGDDTAKDDGRISLNPLRHIDPIGLLVLAFAGFGWAKPVMVNMQKFKNPKIGMAITAFAGPLSNIILAIVLMPIYAIFMYYAPEFSIKFAKYGSELLLQIIIMSIGLAVFNMFPIPPLDGSKVLEAVFPQQMYFTIMRYEKYGMLILLALILTDVITPVITAITSAVFSYLYEIAIWTYGILPSIL